MSGKELSTAICDQIAKDGYFNVANVERVIEPHQTDPARVVLLEREVQTVKNIVGRILERVDLLVSKSSHENMIDPSIYSPNAFRSPFMSKATAQRPGWRMYTAFLVVSEMTLGPSVEMLWMASGNPVEWCLDRPQHLGSGSARVNRLTAHDVRGFPNAPTQHDPVVINGDTVYVR